jgi:hypothetical protein
LLSAPASGFGAHNPCSQFNQQRVAWIFAGLKPSEQSDARYKKPFPDQERWAFGIAVLRHRISPGAPRLGRVASRRALLF